MSRAMLVVGKDTEFFRKEQIGWNKRGISIIRVETMQEGIEQLCKGQFLFVVISAASVNYLPLLNIMCELSPVPVILGTYKFSVREQVEALHNGVAAYTIFLHNSEDNILSALALLQSYNKHGSRAKKPPRTVASGNLTAYYDLHQAFCKDKEIELTPTEFRLLYYIFSNPNTKLTFRHITRRVWDVGYDDVSHNAIWQHVNKLKKKLSKADFNGGNIENIHGVGYRFIPHYSKTC